MVQHLQPVLVKRCTEPQESEGCAREGRHLCRVEHRTECRSSMEYRLVKEDYPSCTREKVHSCSVPQEGEGDGESCRQVEVIRCHIEKREVKKARPVTKCQRVPVRLCAKLACKK